MMPGAETLRVLRLAGLFTWLLIAIAALVEGVGRPWAFATWLGALVLFGALYAWTTSRWPRTPGLRWAAVAAQLACVLVMAGNQYRGFEGMLLVLVALELALIASRAVGLAWIAAQSLTLLLAIQYRWSWYEALLFTPPYLAFQVLAFVVVELIGREASGRAALARTNAELVSTRELLAGHARLDERLRIARELHDAMGHHLAGLSLHLEALAQREQPSPPLDTARALTRRLFDDVESLVTTLDRDRGVDLSRALAALAIEIPRPRVHVDADGVTQTDPARAHALLRCCQEIVTNAVKHASAENLWITLRRNDTSIELIARDDGVGASTTRSGHGLDGMRRRLAEIGGSLDIETRPSGGFELRAVVPERPA
jgi:signal transduction histidine kinase